MARAHVAVGETGLASDLDGNARRAQTLGVDNGFVEQGVVPCGSNEGGRQAAEIALLQRV